MVTLEPHQVKAMNSCLEILRKDKFVVFNGEMRTGKTFTAIAIASQLYLDGLISNCLLITKKGSIDDIESQIAEYGCSIFKVINYESLHNVGDSYDFIIADEYHSLGYIAKRKRVENKSVLHTKLSSKTLEMIKRKYFMGMTGTVHLETFSTSYSLFPICFRQYRDFYHWAKDFVDVKQKKIGQRYVNDYTHVRDVEKLFSIINPFIVTVTQEDAGFSTKVDDVIHMVRSENIEKLCNIIKEKKLYRFKDETIIVADSIAKEFQIIKQLQSGCLKIGENQYKTLDCYKFDYIMKYFKDLKICIYHEYIGERMMLEHQLKLYGYTVTNNQVDFNKGDNKTVFLGQFVSKREGQNLSSCNDLIFFSMPYSNLTYLQTRERCILKNKDQPVRCHFICTEFEKEVYDIVRYKKGKFSSQTYRESRKNERNRRNK